MLEVDHLDQLQSRFGKAVGNPIKLWILDLINRKKTKSGNSLLGETDIASRVDDKGIALLLPEKNLQEANALAESVRSLVTGKTFFYDNKTSSITLSIGICSTTGDLLSTADFFIKVESAAVTAQKNGGDQIVSSF
jgi:diguanylate cyclase (GGDEF)-like protein